MTTRTEPRPAPTDTGDPAPPHDVAAEQAVLGAAILKPELIPDLSAILRDDDLYRPAHVSIWAALCDLSATGRPVDELILVDHLEQAGDLGRVGGRLYVHGLVENVPLTSSATHYAGIVAQHANRRRVIETARRLLQVAQTGDHDTLAGHIARTRDELDHAATHDKARRPLRWDDFWTRPAEPPDLLAAGILARGRITLLYSPGKTGKSLLAQEISARLAMSAPCLDDPAREAQRVLYVDQEMTLDDWRDRLDDFRVLPGDPLDPLALYNLADWPPFDTAEGGAALAAAAADHRADLVVIDTLSKVCEGEENSNDTFQAFYRHTLVPLKRAGRAALVLDHTGKDVDRGARGGRSKTDNVDLVFELLVRGRDLLSLKRTHARFRHPTELMYLRRRTEPFLTHELETVDENAEKVIDVCLQQLRAFNVEQTESGAAVLKRFRGYGSKFTDATFYEAWHRFRDENGWTT